MKKLVFFLALALLFFSCSHKDDIRIHGQFSYGNGRMVYLSLLTADGLQLLDSSTIRNSSFQFKIKTDELTLFLGSDEPGFFHLSFTPDNALTTLLHRGQSVDIEADANNLIGSYRVHGPEDALLMWELDSSLASFATYTDTLLEIYHSYVYDDDVRGEVERRYNEAVEQHTQYLRAFIRQHPSSFSSMIAFYQVYNRRRFFDEQEDAALLQFLTDSLAATYTDSRYVEYLQKRLQ